jgi:hypothetical protein
MEHAQEEKMKNDGVEKLHSLVGCLRASGV